MLAILLKYEHRGEENVTAITVSDLAEGVTHSHYKTELSQRAELNDMVISACNGERLDI